MSPVELTLIFGVISAIVVSLTVLLYFVRHQPAPIGINASNDAWREMVDKVQKERDELQERLTSLGNEYRQKFRELDDGCTDRIRNHEQVWSTRLKTANERIRQLEEEVAKLRRYVDRQPPDAP